MGPVTGEGGCLEGKRRCLARTEENKYSPYANQKTSGRARGEGPEQSLKKRKPTLGKGDKQPIKGGLMGFMQRQGIEPFCGRVGSLRCGGGSLRSFWWGNR